MFINRDYKKPRSRIIAKKFIEDFLRNNKNAKILELGGHKTPMTEFFPQITTLDIDASLNPDIVANAENMKMIKNETYDLIYSCHFFEHVHDPEKVLDECYRILKKNGIIFSIVPVVKLKNLWKDGGKGNYHVHVFNKENIKNLLENSNFRLVSINYRVWVKPYIFEKYLGNILKRGDIFFTAKRQ